MKGFLHIDTRATRSIREKRGSSRMEKGIFLNWLAHIIRTHRSCQEVQLDWNDDCGVKFATSCACLLTTGNNLIPKSHLTICLIALRY